MRSRSICSVALSLLSACVERGGTAAVDSATAVALAVRAVRATSPSADTAGGLAGAATADSAGFLVTVRLVCDTSSGVGADGRAYRKGCGGGDATVRVTRSGSVRVVERGE
jgi:hypothetical protein